MKLAEPFALTSAQNGIIAGQEVATSVNHFHFVCRFPTVLLGVALLPRVAVAQQVVVTVTGTVADGTDGNPNSTPPGMAKVFAGASDLSGQPFTLTMILNASQGTNSLNTCPDGSVSQSSNMTNGQSSGNTAILQIGAGSYTFGILPTYTKSWEMYRSAPASCATPYSAVGVGWGENYTGSYSGSAAFGNAILYTSSPLPSGDWRTAIPPTAVNATTFGFAINLTDNGTLLGYASGDLTPVTVTVSSATIPPAKSSGSDQNAPGTCFCGEPINIATGNLFEKVTDYETAGDNRLAWTRYYNTLGNSLIPATFATALGVNWRSTFDRYLHISPATGPPTSVVVERADGQMVTFTLTNGFWTTDTDVDLALVQAGSNWTVTDHSDTVETYVAGNSGEGLLASIQARGGYTQTLTYAAGALMSVADSYNRTLSFAYLNGLLQTVTTPDGLVLTYGYNPGDILAGTLNRLASVTYSTSPQTSQSYLYENAVYPFALTGILDEDGNRYTTWSYDSQGRSLSSQHAGGADLTTVAYDDTTGNRTVTKALGQQYLYKFTTLQGVPKVTEIDRQVTTTTAAATRTFTYDSNGYLASQTDWNGNLTTYVNDIHGQPTSMTEASATPQARTTTATYHAVYHLPLSIVTPGLTSTFTYDANGNLLTKTLTDTTTTVAPYVTTGTARTWTYTWSNFLLASVMGPRTDAVEKTDYTYDATGALTKIVNALGQSTQITTHLPGGLPTAVVDPNGVTTTLTYDARQRLLTSSIATNAGALTTRYAYDAAGNLLSTTLPDGSKLSNTFDVAHRLTAVTDLFNQSISYTLDALGDETQAQVANSSAVVQRKHGATFDALGRMLQDIGGVGQITSYTYDADGNALTLQDPLSHTTHQTFDTFNRVAQVTDAAGGITKTTYDPHDRPLTVTDPIGGVTTFVYDGFGDVIEQISPATGTTIYTYDLAGNLTQRIDATGATTNETYDALDRRITTTYPADAAENVTFKYDQAGHGFGVGRLTGVTDAAGSLTRTYDERGNVLSETRVHPTATLVTGYGYDKANRVASITYPSGMALTYTRDSMGRVTAASTKASSAGTPQAVVSNVAYEPFGPPNAWTYGNGVADARSFDLDYRLTGLTDTGTHVVQGLTYGYDAANNVLSIMDAVTAGTSQSFGHDGLDRLTNAQGGYGSFGYSYDSNGNRLTETPGGAAIGTVAATVDGLASVSALTYNQAGRLAAAVPASGQSTQYIYDAFGQRLAATNSGAILYQYDLGGHLLEEADGFANPSADYIYLGNTPVADVAPMSGKMYFLHTDRLGTPQIATDTNQAVQWQTSYQPFGATGAITQDQIIVQDLRLPGQELEHATGLYHNGFREYASALGMYIESDPIGLVGGTNTYAYGLDDPADLIDPKGTDVEVWSRPIDLNGPFSILNPLGIQHWWIRTNTYEAGMGPLGSNSAPGQGEPDLPFITEVATTNHSGQSLQQGSVQLDLPFAVDEVCVNKKIKPGQNLGGFIPWNNDCHTFVNEVLNQCRVPQAPGPAAPNINPQ